MDVLLLALTVAPGLAVSLFIYLKDKYDPEPFVMLVWAFVGGMISTIPASFCSIGLSQVQGLAGGGGGMDKLGYAYITVAFSEETAKLFFLLFFYSRKFFDEPFDGITYSVMTGMGFATLENILYVFSDDGQQFSTALIRMLTAIPAHASFAVIMGYFAGLAKFRPGYRGGYLMLGLLGAIVSHGTYDFLLMLNNYPYIAYGSIISLLVSIWLSLRAIRLHQQNSPFKPVLPW